MSIDEGVIKFDFSQFSKTKSLDFKEIEDIEKARKSLYQLGLIGEYEDIHIGYGNLSKKVDYSSIHLTSNVQFLISGTQTGGLSNLTGDHYTRVIDYDLKKNTISASGPIYASSESLTHAAIYECNENIRVVIHIHNLNIWRGIIRDSSPSTKKDIPYGTIEMAKEVKRLIGHKENGFLAMQGHEEGVITYGCSIKEAMDICIELNQMYNS